MNDLHEVVGRARPRDLYLLSALSMLAGCNLLSDALLPAVVPGRLANLVLLLGTVRAYEAALIASAALLARRFLAREDARTLLLLQSVFMVDVTLLGSEAFAMDVRAGLAVNAALFAFGLLGVTVAARVVGQPLKEGEAAWFALAYGALLAVPGLVAGLAGASALSPATLFLGWTVAGALPVLRLLLRAPLPSETLPRAWAVLPFASLLAHLLSSGWTWSMPFLLAYLSPLAIGLGVSLAAWLPGEHEEWSWSLCGAGLLLALGAPAVLVQPLPLFEVPFSPLRAGLFACALAAGVAYVRSRGPAHAAAGSSAFVLALAGHDLESMWRSTTTFLARAWSTAPDTPGEKGAFAVALAFLLLFAGVASSIVRAARAPEER